MIFVIVVVITIVSLFGCVCIKKPAVRLGLEIIVVLGLMLAVLISSVTYTTRYRVNFVDSSTSQDGKYELLFQQIGDPDWPFGYTHARLVLKDELGTIGDVSDIFKRNNCNITHLGVYSQHNGYSDLIIRINTFQTDALEKDLNASGYRVLSITKNPN